MKTIRTNQKIEYMKLLMGFRKVPEKIEKQGEA